MTLFNIIKSSEEFDNMTQQNNICVVDFFATWCGPCTNLAKKLSEMSQTNEILQKVTFIKVDVDNFQDLAELYNVSALPYLIFFKNGKLTEYYVTGNDPEKVVSVIYNLLN